MRNECVELSEQRLEINKDTPTRYILHEQMFIIPQYIGVWMDTIPCDWRFRNTTIRR